MRNNPQPQEMYRHFKGNLYQIRCIAKHSETGELMVVYQAMYGDFQIYVRPLAMFMEEVDKAKYPDVSQKYRFELVDTMTSVETISSAAYTTKTISEDKQETEPEVQQLKEADKVIRTEEKEREELNIEPLVLEFLDADSYEKRLEILGMLHYRITDEMINMMAVAVDIEIKEGDIESRYDELKNCLLTFKKYEGSRLRS